MRVKAKDLGLGLDFGLGFDLVSGLGSGLGSAAAFAFAFAVGTDLELDLALAMERRWRVLTGKTMPADGRLPIEKHGSKKGRRRKFLKQMALAS